MVVLTLASASPRRQELLRLTGWKVVTRPAEVEERQELGETPGNLTRRLAVAKARATVGELALGADTVVVRDDEVLGKPADEVQARLMLQALRGRRHRAISSIALVDANGQTLATDTCVSDVPMRKYTDAEIEGYLATGNPLDKAGAYGIQDGGFQPVSMDGMQDCFANVMGLPLCHLVRTMRRLGHEPPADVPAACQAHTGYDCRVFPAILRGEQ